MIDPEDAPAHNESAEDAPCYAPRGDDFLIGLAQEALSFTKRRKLEKEIAVIKFSAEGPWRQTYNPSRQATQNSS